MKPLYLSMTAFGPYKDRQEIDFGAFRSGLYLITGDTGAGKTTIYDAIMFALFEETSNKPNGKDTEKGSVRDKTMVHSNFASKSEPTVVELRFEEDGTEYTVKRTCKYSKKRGTEDEYGDPKFDADLSDGAGVSVTGSEKVTKKIEQIVGMDAVQFRQIVMLAQGEFKAFMEAKDNARKDILGRLFDSSSYVALMDVLTAAKQKLNSRAESERKHRAMIMAEDAFPLPETMGPEERALYAPNHPQLLQNIRALAEKESAEAKTADAAYTEADQALQQLRAKLTTAEEHNKELAERDRLAAEQKRLDEQKEPMEKLRTAAARAAKAVRSVLPAEDAARSAGVQVKSAQTALENAQKALGDATAAQKQAAAEAKNNPQRADQAKVCRAQAEQIAATLADYDTLKTEENEQKKAEQALDIAEKSSAAERKKLDGFSTQLEQTEAELQTLADADAVAVRAETEAKKTGELLEELDKLERKISAIREIDSRLKTLLADWQQAKDAAELADREYKNLNSIFLGSQAAQLARKLRMDISVSGTAVCPVCGKAACADDVERFAVLTGEAVTEEQVKAAEKRSKAAERVFNNANISLAEKRKERESAVENARTEADRLLPENMPWAEEMLLDEAVFRQAWYAKELAANRASVVLEKARNDQRRKKELDEKKIEFTNAMQKAAEAAAAQNTVIAQQKTLAEQHAKRRSELSEKLAYPDRAAAEAFVTEQRAEAQKLEGEAEQAAETLQKTEKALASARTAEEVSEQNLAQAQEAQAKADSAFAAAVSENGFADAADYRAALPGAERLRYENWLGEQSKKINDYDNAVLNTAGNLRRQQEKVKDYVFTPLEKLEQREKEKTAEVKNLLAEKTGRENILRLRRSAEKKIEASLRDSGRIEAAYRRVGLLADTAAGSNSDGGRHAFDGFVLGRYFREILQRATMHLDIMTGGRYTLVHESRGRSKASASDFVIQIRDQYNGEQREIGSISGGEGFQVSMALALGLSDVAQAHVHGGRRIEAMFIDEGFGTLDSEALGNMLAALKNVSGGSRLIGLISHVDSLEEVIPDKIEVKCLGERKGSRISRE